MGEVIQFPEQPSGYAIECECGSIAWHVAHEDGENVMICVNCDETVLLDDMVAGLDLLKTAKECDV